MPQTLPFCASRPKSKDFEREKTSLSGRLPAISVVYSAPVRNVAQRRADLQIIFFMSFL